ncbi:unnamed protein product [Periconia digitata]|uniref:TAFII55 protein conserved region domain-containing protein n=1 Tax=Periconia digitata TaxID=1303443 RepID=A0A9W4XEJ1_9PLEO|nr:unnamed protein product [Periconia digitata]
MKLKLKAPGPASGDAPPAPAPTSAPASAAPSTSATATPTTSAPKLNLKFKSSAQPSQDTPVPVPAPPGDAPKQKRKYTKKPKLDEDGQPITAAKAAPKPKKRPLEDGEEGTPAKRKPKPTQKSLERTRDSDEDDEADMIAVAAAPKKAQTQKKAPARTQSVKLSLKTKVPGQPQRAGTAVLKMKTQGRPPPRPPGAGYDSEAEDAEDDPAIEQQFVLRMEPGPDNDLLRKSIEERTIGKKQSEGGPGVQIRFLDRDGRRSIVTIQGRMYAATMVELPCVIESLKSWNKKDWVKTADVCQMLLVLGRVNSEDEAKKVTRPKTIEPDTHRFAHGLTPPMNWVRRRRFRPRKSYLDVERIESQTEALLAEDEQAHTSKYELIDSEEEGSGGEEFDDQDAMGDDEDMYGADYTQTPLADQVDEQELEAALAQGLLEDMEEGGLELQTADGEDLDINALFGSGDANAGEATIEVETPVATSHDVAMHALGGQHHNGELVVEPESAASTPAAATSPEDDDDDDDDDDDEVDPEAAAKQEQDELVRGEIRELEDAITNAQNQLKETTNVLFKRRLLDRIAKQEQDLKVKLSLIGEQADD